MTDADPVQALGETLVTLGWDPEQYTAWTFAVDFGPPHVPIADAVAAVVPDEQQFVLYINVGVAAPPEQRDEVARFIARANWGLTIGNFELDYDDGHVRFKSSIAFGEDGLSAVAIRNAIYWAMNAVEAYAEALVDVIAGKSDSGAAIAAVEA
jgi:hypothetical protein